MSGNHQAAARAHWKRWRERRALEAAQAKPEEPRRFVAPEPKETRS